MAHPVCLTQGQQGCRDLICKLQHPGRVGKQEWTFLLKSCSLLFFMRGQMKSGQWLLGRNRLLQVGKKHTASGKAVLMEPSAGPGYSLSESSSARVAGGPGLILFA